MKIAFVIPWFGIDIPGGAESHCREFVFHLKENNTDVEILTTCVKEFQSNWNEDYYPEGVSNCNGIPVRRFKVRKGNHVLFNELNQKILRGEILNDQDEESFIREIVNSDHLLDYIEEHAHNYCFFFIPYMFGTTYWGSQISPERSFLIPCLHDEGYAKLNIMKRMFENVHGAIFNSQPEMDLAQKLYDMKNVKRILLGGGVETDIDPHGERFRKQYGIHDNFILYAGRKDRTKNTHLLIEYFKEYRSRRERKIKLVLIGNGTAEVGEECQDAVVDLGFLSPEAKLDAMAAASVVCQPSTNESFSKVIMEAWLCQTPVLVNANCDVTKHHCHVSNGGLYFRDYFEYEECLEFILDNRGLSKKMARNGKEYVLENFQWGTIIQRFKKEVLTSLEAGIEE